MARSGFNISRESTYDQANIVSKILFFWVWEFFLRCFNRDVRVEDLPKCPKSDKSERLGLQLQRAWEKQLAIKSKGGSASLLKALISVFGVKYTWLGVLIVFIQLVVMIAQTLFMGFLVRELAQYSLKDTSNSTAIYLHALGVVVSTALVNCTIHPFFFETVRMGMDMRIACCHLIYKKSLKLSKSALALTTIGQIVNMLSNDVNRFDWCPMYPPYLYVGPLMTALVTCLLYFSNSDFIFGQGFGWECLPALALLLLYIPLQWVLGTMFSKLRSQTAELTDERVRITNEFVKAMKVIKMYAWEKPFAEMVDRARRKEVEMIKKASYLRGLNLGLFFVSAKIILFVMLMSFVIDHCTLSAEGVFVAMSLINQLRIAVCLYVPYAVSNGAEALVSISRIQEFLMLDEIHQNDESPVLGSASSIKLINVAANYTHNQEDLLVDVSMDAEPGQLVALIGSVGAGKSSVLLTILGELPTLSGQTIVSGKVAYASQEAWTFPGTVRDNILFGQPYNPNRYREVIKVCALERDLQLLQNDDKTMIGDTGLSGGQRARVNLARALYSEADIYLLDDPLSAVDTSVAKHIFDQAIKGYLKDKITVLVTHQLQFVKNADKILLLKGGRPLVYGNYSDILKSGFDFIKFTPEPPSVEDGDEVSLAAIQEEVEVEKVTTVVVSGAGRPIFHRSVSRSSSVRSRGSIKSNKSIKSTKSTSSHNSVRSRFPTIKRDRFGSTMSRTSGIHSTVGLPGAPFVPITNGTNKQLVINEVDTDSLLDNDEFDETGEENLQASGKAYWTYISSGGGCGSLFFLVLTLLAAQVVFTVSDWWLSLWTEEVQELSSNFSIKYNINYTDPDFCWQMSTKNATFEFKHPLLASSQGNNVLSYGIQTLVVAILAIIRTLAFFVSCMKASVKLHDRLFKCLVRAPMSFFDNNPVGVLLNRCSRDMGIIDDILPATFFDALSILLLDLGIAVMICCIDPWILVPTFALLAIFMVIRKLYVDTARGIKKLEGVTRSPVFSHLATSLNGLATIRAFRAQSRFMVNFDVHQDNHSASWFLFVSASRWFGVVLDWLCVGYILGICVSMLSRLDGGNGAEVGLAITSAIMLTTGFQWGIRQATEVETQMTSVERVDEFSRLPSEGDLYSMETKKPPKEWPQSGAIDFCDVSLMYKEEDGPVLRNLNFSVKGKEKIGIVGRTGAGKSSIINTLFRLTEPEGEIFIDGVAVGEIGLHDLRQKISIIPQEPVLFSGTIRKNLDPFSKISDGKLWKALDEVQLRESVQDIAGGLEATISGEGSSFSVGQRQLVCLARAILRQNKILILDEATANVDPKTDALIQTTIRKAFADCTILTIAHRLDTIIDSDRVLVLDAGQVAEFDEPIALLKDENSIFSGMVKAAGKDTATKLKLMAQKAHDARQLSLNRN